MKYKITNQKESIYIEAESIMEASLIYLMRKGITIETPDLETEFNNHKPLKPHNKKYNDNQRN